MARKKADHDWRNLPRKATGDCKSDKLSIRIRPADLVTVRKRARRAGQTIGDYVIACCCD